VVLLYPEADLREGKLRRGTEYKPEGVLEYLLAYPRIPTRYYPIEKEPSLYPYPEARGRKKPEPYPEVREKPYKEAKPEPYPEPKTGYPPERPPEYPPDYPPEYPPPPSSKLPPPGITEGGTEKRRGGYEGAVAWAQGQLRRGKKLVTTYRVWKRPFRQDDLEAFDENELPPGVKIVPGISSAYETVQQFRGKVAPGEEQVADIGAFVATIHQPEAKPGKAGAIKFKRDVPPSKVRGEKPDAWEKLPMHTTLVQLMQIVFRSTAAQVDKLGVDTLEAMGMEAQEAKVAKPSAKVRFAKSRLAEKLEKASRAEIVSAINSTGLSASETKELLKMLPDRERQQLILALSEPKVHAPTRGMPKAEYLPTKLRRKKPKTKKTAKVEPMLTGARL